MRPAGEATPTVEVAGELGEGRSDQLPLKELLGGVGLLVEYFRFGDEHAMARLECFLSEAGFDVHAEVLIDELAGALETALGGRRDDEPGAGW